jgi:hypothetical protein
MIRTGSRSSEIDVDAVSRIESKSFHFKRESMKVNNVKAFTPETRRRERNFAIMHDLFEGKQKRFIEQLSCWRQLIFREKNFVVVLVIFGEEFQELRNRKEKRKSNTIVEMKCRQLTRFNDEKV